MSEPTDKQVSEEQLNEYLQGDSLVSRQYRQISADEVPTELDHQVLRQAHDAVKAPSTQGRRHLRWAAPLALAASAVLVVSIVIETGVQHDVVMTGEPITTSTTQDGSESLRDEAAGNAAGSESEAPEALQARQAEKQEVRGELKPSAPVDAEAPSIAAREMARERAPAAAPPPPAQAVESISKQERPSTAISQSADREPRSLNLYSAPSETPAVSSEDKAEAARAGAMSSEQRAQRSLISMHMDPERWLQHIRDLRKENRQVEADSEWRRFRQMFPDYSVSDADVAREIGK